MTWLGILILFAVQASELNPSPAVPEAPGVYFRQDAAHWISFRPAVISNASARGMEMFVYTGAYTDLAMSLSCPGPRATIRISLKKPSLHVREIGSSKDVVLVRLKKKKDRRVLKSAFSNVTVQNKGGFDRKDLFKLSVSEYPDGTFSVTPEKALPAGEYLLVFSSASTAYDFGVDKVE